MPRPFLAAIMGPTGSGKTRLAEQLADTFGAQLINADAFQVYRGMDVGTAKPSDRLRYRLLDIKDPNESFGLGEFVRLAHAELEKCFESETNVIVVGGTGLYIRALFEEYADMAGAADPELRAKLENRIRDHGLASLVKELQDRAPEVAEKLDLKNPIRVSRALERLESQHPIERFTLPGFLRIKFALVPEQANLDLSLTTRHQLMVQNGWIQEVKRLLLEGYGSNDPGFRAIGYREWIRYLEGNVGLEEAEATIIAETRSYSKRQRTWIRSEPNVTLIDPDESRTFLDAETRVRFLSA